VFLSLRSAGNQTLYWIKWSFRTHIMKTTILRNASPSNEELSTLDSDYETPTVEPEVEYPGYDAVHDYYSW